MVRSTGGAWRAKLWAGRRRIVRWCVAGALAGLVIGFQHPQGVHGYGEAGPGGAGREAVAGRTGLPGLDGRDQRGEHELGGCDVSGAVPRYRAVGAVHDRACSAWRSAWRGTSAGCPSRSMSPKSCAHPGGAPSPQRRSRRWDGSRGCSARRTTNAAERA